MTRLFSRNLYGATGLIRLDRIHPSRYDHFRILVKHFRWVAIVALVGIQGLFPRPGGGAEPSRNLSATPGRTALSSPEKAARVAIVIGNSKYPSGALANPRNDATAMAGALRKLGFDVDFKLDATKADIDGLLRRFSVKVEKAGVAAMFYAGHGIQVSGNNYLVPIDANPRSEKDLKRDMVKMDDVIDDMGDARVKLVFFDACRDNPLSRSFSRGGTRGMAAPVEATGTLISFATKHGNTAADGDTNHSPYTAALLAALTNPAGIEIEQLLRRVQQGVKAETNGQQEPWRYGSLDGDFYFVDPVDNTKATQEALEKAFQESTRRTNEQLARERTEFQQSLKAQQEATERALREANEKAARERAELQQAMEKMLHEALAKQNAALELDRQARQAATGITPVKPVGAPPPAPVVALVTPVAATQSLKENDPIKEELAAKSPIASDLPANLTKPASLPAPTNPTPSHPASPTGLVAAGAARSTAKEPGEAVEPSNPTTADHPASTPIPTEIAKTKPEPLQLAMVTPAQPEAPVAVPGKAVAPLANNPNDEWEYLVTDNSFKNRQKLVMRVKASGSQGVLEDIVWNDRFVLNWVFGSAPTVIGTPNDAGFILGPHWDGSFLRELLVEGGTGICSDKTANCRVSLREIGVETVTVPAGTFEATKLEGWFSANVPIVGGGGNTLSASGRVNIWYSKDQRRLLRQTVVARAIRFFVDETIELSAVRRVK